MRRDVRASRLPVDSRFRDYRFLRLASESQPMDANHCALTESALDSRARRSASRVGLVVRKSRRHDPLNNCGGYMLLDPTMNIPVWGFQYDLSAEDVIEYCNG